MFGKSFKVGLLGLLLVGCTTTKTPGIKVEYVDRPVVTMKTCITPKEIPVRPQSLGSDGPPSNLETALSLALAKVSEWTRYGNKSDVILQGCAR